MLPVSAVSLLLDADEFDIKVSITVDRAIARVGRALCSRLCH
jgi:hypothetical protein